MEGRTLLSTLTVMNANDHGPGSLRAALGAASPGDVIKFTSRLDGQTITLTSGPLDVTVGVTIDGPGAGALTVSGGGTQQVFTVPAGVTATIEGLTIADGYAIQGGGIDNSGTLTVEGCTLSGNGAFGGSGNSTTPDAANGGGIANEVGANLTLAHDLFAGNEAVASPGNDAFGGGLLNLGSATVAGCTFTGNQVTGGSSSSYYAGSYGGAIDSFGFAPDQLYDSTLKVSDSTFTGNDATAPSGPYFADAAAIDVEFGAVASITGCGFTANLATGGAGAEGQGGAIFAEGCDLTLNESTFTDNRAVSGPFNAAVAYSGSVSGGAIFLLAGATVDLTGCTLVGNQAIAGGGNTNSAALQFDGQSSGGAIDADGPGSLSLTGCTLLGNQAVGGSGANSISSHNGIAAGGGILASNGETLTVLDSSLVGNVARGGFGTAISGALSEGGGIADDAGYLGVGSTATVTGSVLLNNEAIGGAGAAGVPGGVGLGGGIEVASESYFGFADNSSLSFNDSTLLGNIALGGAGGAGADGGDGWGGGVYVGTGGTASFDEALITLNAALGGAAGSGGSTGEGIGGGLYVASGGNVSLKKTAVVLNVASTSNNDIYGAVTYF